MFFLLAATWVVQAGNASHTTTDSTSSGAVQNRTDIPYTIVAHNELTYDSSNADGSWNGGLIRAVANPSGISKTLPFRIYDRTEICSNTAFNVSDSFGQDIKIYIHFFLLLGRV